MDLCTAIINGKTSTVLYWAWGDQMLGQHLFSVDDREIMEEYKLFCLKAHNLKQMLWK